MEVSYYIAIVFSIANAANKRITFRKHAFVLAIVLLGLLALTWIDDGFTLLPLTDTLMQTGLAYGAGLGMFHFYRLIASDRLRARGD